MRRAAATALVVIAAALAGCAEGTPSGDLFVVERSGSLPGADLRLRVTDGGFVLCDGGPQRQITSQQLIDARAIARALNGKPDEGEPGIVETAPRNPPRPGSQLRYEVRSEEGVVSFADNSRPVPEELQELQALVRDLAQGPCGRDR